MTTDDGPPIRSAAIEACPNADVIDIQAVPLVEGVESDPVWWAGQIFHPQSLSPAVGALFALRRLLVPFIGVPTHTGESMKSVFKVDQVLDDEAVIERHERHLSFWCAVRISHEQPLLVVTTVVKLHGWRGRVYWLPVGSLHAPVTRTMMRRAIARTGQV